jgi:hypothetical protein
VSTFPGTPRVARGAIASLDPQSPVAKVVPFQYNPDTLTRSLTHQYGQGEGARSEVLRLKGPPVEEISLDVELDATDKLENPDQNPDATSKGVLPQLAALEIISYPSSDLVQSNADLAAQGTIEIEPPDSPFTVFVWGKNRVLPVRLTSYQITEEAYDTNLNPIRAKVSLKMRVLTYDDFDPSHPGYNMFLTRQQAKEQMADSGRVTGTTSDIESGTVRTS